MEQKVKEKKVYNRQKEKSREMVVIPYVSRESQKHWPGYTKKHGHTNCHEAHVYNHTIIGQTPNT